jgi:ABC-type polar amino acid transport system ATPase subunit
MDLIIKNLTKKYNGKTVLDGVNLNLENVQVLSLIGASGSGKSTLLRLIAGLEAYDEGNILVNGHSVDENTAESYRKRVGFVFQDNNLFSHLSIEENIYLVLEKVHGKKRALIAEDVQRRLEQFGLTEHRLKLPHQISGGQSQRASIVRALAIEPELMLLDEPTSSLDPILTYEVLSAVKQLALNKIDFIIVTHELGFAKNVGDYIVFMEEGRIIEHGGREILENPKSQSLKYFLDKVLSFDVHNKM